MKWYRDSLGRAFSGWVFSPFSLSPTCNVFLNYCRVLVLVLVCPLIAMFVGAASRFGISTLAQYIICKLQNPPWWFAFGRLSGGFVIVSCGAVLSPVLLV